MGRERHSHRPPEAWRNAEKLNTKTKRRNNRSESETEEEEEDEIFDPTANPFDPNRQKNAERTTLPATHTDP